MYNLIEQQLEQTQDRQQFQRNEPPNQNETQRQRREEEANRALSHGEKLVHQPACAGKTELFFSERTSDMRVAQVICATCEVRQSCLDQARQCRPFAGVWGGVIFVNGEELLLKRGRGRPRKSEQLDNARVIKALAEGEGKVDYEDEENSDEFDESQRVLDRHIA